MKNGWTTKRLGDVCEVVNGGTPKTSVAEYWGGEHLWITPAEMGKRESPYADDTERRLTDAGLRDSSARMLPPYSVILSSRAPIGHLVINTKPMSTNQGCKSLIPGSQLEHKFLYYYLSSIVELLDSLGTGATFKELSGSKLKEVSVPVLPLAEQQRIVGVLDEAFAGLATAQAHAAQNLQNAHALFESHLQSAFTHRGKGWVEKALTDICEISSALVDPREKQFLDLPHVGGANIKSKTGALLDLKTARQEGLISGKFVFDDRTVLYSKIRPYLMKVARPDFRGLCSADIYPLTPKSGQVDRDFLFHLLLSKHFTDYANIGSARAGMPKVNREHLFAYRTFVPPMAKQTELATQLDALAAATQRLTRLYEQKQAALTALKKSLLHQAFTGELTESKIESKVIPFSVALAGMKPTDLHAGILAKAYQMHEARGNERDFGHVKAEKIAHMIEADLGIDLGRQPIKDAAGPNDFQHLKKVEHRAKMADFFTFQRIEGGPYRVKKAANVNAIIERTDRALTDRRGQVDRLLNLMLPMKTRQAEIVATVYAAWNNLLLDDTEVSDESIVQEARENWHPEKMIIPREKFFAAIKWMKEHKLIPSGRGRRVGAKSK